MLDWSPEQVSGWLKIQCQDDESMRFPQARGVLKKELIGDLGSECRMRRSQHSRGGGQSRGQIVDAISIRESRDPGPSNSWPIGRVS
jgi:hypothetical protein